MPIKDLKARQGNVDIVVEVTEKQEPRTFEKFGRQGRVCNATIKDDSGECKLTLWNDDCDKIDAGDKIHLTNGYVNEWQGELQVTTGKFGKLEVVEKGKGQPEKKEEEPKKDLEEDSDYEESDVEEENVDD